MLRDFRWRRRQKKKLREWEQNGRQTNPPAILKQMTVEEYARRYNIPVLIETGTYKGHMLLAMRRVFERLYSIELDETLFRNAVDRLKKFSHIHIRQGDSGDLLDVVLSEARGPCLLWLDAHYSGGKTARGINDTPIGRELRTVFKYQDKIQVILIDDAGDFVGGGDYPALEELENLVRSECPDRTFEVRDDIIRICPATAITD
ncbi:hypothetical protein ACFL4W_05670 [Planctomycetota bacterium]